MISSDLGRSHSTALIVNKNLNLPLKTNSQLREKNMGEANGKLLKDVKGKYLVNYSHKIFGPEQIHLDFLNYFPS